jgi:predicted membrane protein
VTVVVHASVNAGRVEMFGVEQNGTGVDVNRTFPGPAKNPRTLTVNIAMGFGDVEVQHAAA